MKPYRFHRAARAEYRGALAWYAARSLDAADGFAHRVTEGIRQIRELPEAWPAWPGRGDIRVRILQRFPYLIAYAVRDHQIVVIAIAHRSRRPGYWLARITGYP